MRLTVILAALCAVLFASNASANRSVSSHPRHTAYSAIGCSDPIMRPCEGGAQKDRQIRFERKYVSPVSHIAQRNGGAHRGVPPGLRRVMAEGAGRVVSHPAGCPARAFCGCGASVERFGRSVRSLWLAANWLRFPRAEPAPGRAAVRRDGHHVVILREHVRGQIWIVYDANSGRHRTRVHPRSIAGFVIVDPSAGA